jgi:hypothetical protein
MDFEQGSNGWEIKLTGPHVQARGKCGPVLRIHGTCKDRETEFFLCTAINLAK